VSALSVTVSGSGVTAVGGLIPSGCEGGGSVGILIRPVQVKQTGL
jgi:hypothetical protein